MENMIQIEKDEYKKVDRAYVELSAVLNMIRQVVNKDVVIKLEAAQKELESFMKPFWEEDEEKLDAYIEGFSEIQRANKFTSVWSMYEEVSPEEMKSGECPLDIEFLIYEQSWGEKQKVKVDKKLTWLEVWEICDKMIKSSGDLHHLFIEDLVDNGSKGFALQTGS